MYYCGKALIISRLDEQLLNTLFEFYLIPISPHLYTNTAVSVDILNGLIEEYSEYITKSRYPMTIKKKFFIEN